MANELAEHCIYPIVHINHLTAGERKHEATPFREKKAWVTGLKLWQEAKKASERMPILLGDATDCSQLLYWGLLTKVEVNGKETRFTVDRLRRFAKGHTPQELRLRSTGKQIARNYIRPYAICKTPDFVKRIASKQL